MTRLFWHLVELTVWKVVPLSALYSLRTAASRKFISGGRLMRRLTCTAWTCWIASNIKCYMGFGIEEKEKGIEYETCYYRLFTDQNMTDHMSTGSTDYFVLFRGDPINSSKTYVNEKVVRKITPLNVYLSVSGKTESCTIWWKQDDSNNI